ncbi:hypothetical protein E4T56_gene8469, partial [Termitomyces sp. T112]
MRLNKDSGPQFVAACRFLKEFLQKIGMATLFPPMMMGIENGQSGRDNRFDALRQPRSIRRGNLVKSGGKMGFYAEIGWANRKSINPTKLRKDLTADFEEGGDLAGWVGMGKAHMALSKVGGVATAQTSLRKAWGDAQHIDLISSVVGSVFKGTGLTLDDVDFVIDSGSDV